MIRILLQNSSWSLIIRCTHKSIAVLFVFYDRHRLIDEDEETIVVYFIAFHRGHYLPQHLMVMMITAAGGPSPHYYTRLRSMGSWSVVQRILLLGDKKESVENSCRDLTTRLLNVCQRKRYILGCTVHCWLMRVFIIFWYHTVCQLPDLLPPPPASFLLCHNHNCDFSCCFIALGQFTIKILTSTHLSCRLLTYLQS